MNNKGKKYAKKVVQSYIAKYGEPDIIIPHSMSMTTINVIAKELNVESKTHMTFQYLGNTSSNSVPIGIISAVEAGKIDCNTSILGCFGGAGMKFASVRIKTEKH